MEGHGDNVSTCCSQHALLTYTTVCLPACLLPLCAQTAAWDQVDVHCVLSLATDRKIQGIHCYHVRMVSAGRAAAKTSRISGFGSSVSFRVAAGVFMDWAVLHLLGSAATAAGTCMCSAHPIHSLHSVALCWVYLPVLLQGASRSVGQGREPHVDAMLLQGRQWSMPSQNARLPSALGDGRHRMAAVHVEQPVSMNMNAVRHAMRQGCLLAANTYIVTSWFHPTEGRGVLLCALTVY
jgi:hypothetical protein